MKSCFATLLFLLLLATSAVSHSVRADSVVDDVNIQLSGADKELARTIVTPLLKLVAIGQYIAGAAIVLILIYAGFLYLKNDMESKRQTVDKLKSVFVASLLIFGATNIVHITGLA